MNSFYYSFFSFSFYLNLFLFFFLFLPLTDSEPLLVYVMSTPFKFKYESIERAQVSIQNSEEKLEELRIEKQAIEHLKSELKMRVSVAESRTKFHVDMINHAKNELERLRKIEIEKGINRMKQTVQDTGVTIKIK